jgi:hypothetical protein
MLRLKVEVAVNGTIEAHGILRENVQALYEPRGPAPCEEKLCENARAYRCKNEVTKHLELGFRAMLGNGDREVRLEWGIG